LELKALFCLGSYKAQRRTPRKYFSLQRQSSEHQNAKNAKLKILFSAIALLKPTNGTVLNHF
jgi:hypothetical protein